MGNGGIGVKTQHLGRWHEMLPQTGSFSGETGFHGRSSHRAHLHRYRKTVLDFNSGR